MKLENINMYQRLRDFKVPASILDKIFGAENDLTKLITAWKALKSDGFSDDETAEELAKIFFKELDISDELKKAAIRQLFLEERETRVPDSSGRQPLLAFCLANNFL